MDGFSKENCMQNVSDGQKLIRMDTGWTEDGHRMDRVYETTVTYIFHYIFLAKPMLDSPTFHGYIVFVFRR